MLSIATLTPSNREKRSPYVALSKITDHQKIKIV